MQAWMVLAVVSACLLAGCADEAGPPTDATATGAGPATSDEPARLSRASAEAADGANGPAVQTTHLAYDYALPSASVAGTSMLNPVVDLRRSLPETLNGTLVEARIAPTPAAGGWELEVYNTPLAGQPRCPSATLGRTELPDGNGTYRIALPADAWTCGWLSAMFSSSGEPAGAITQARVEVWTTTFEGLAMPDGFTAVPSG